MKTKLITTRRPHDVREDIIFITSRRILDLPAGMILQRLTLLALCAAPGVVILILAAMTVAKIIG